MIDQAASNLKSSFDSSVLKDGMPLVMLLSLPSPADLCVYPTWVHRLPGESGTLRDPLLVDEWVILPYLCFWPPTNFSRSSQNLAFLVYTCLPVHKSLLCASLSSLWVTKMSKLPGQIRLHPKRQCELCTAGPIGWFASNSMIIPFWC
jgi:hypothetical protein